METSCSRAQPGLPSAAGHNPHLLVTTAESRDAGSPQHLQQSASAHVLEEHHQLYPSKQRETAPAGDAAQSRKETPGS